MIIGARSKNDGELILTMVEDTLTQNTADENMCRVLTMGLYSAAEQSGILEDIMTHKMMLCILRKYLNR